MMEKVRRYREFIQKYFAILDKETQKPVPFILNIVQRKYYDILLQTYPNLEGVREIVLKARQEGISSFVLIRYLYPPMFLKFSFLKGFSL